MPKNLSELKVKDLEQVCKQIGIPYYCKKRHLTKNEMIENIEASGYEFEIQEAEVPNVVVSVETETQETNVEKETTVVEVEDKPLPDPETFFHTKDKERYIENAEVGTLIAFMDEKGKPRTAALVNRSSKRKVLKVVTEFNWEFIVPYEKVLWVKQGGKWPHGVYRILKEWKYRNGNTNTK